MPTKAQFTTNGNRKRPDGTPLKAGTPIAELVILDDSFTPDQLFVQIRNGKISLSVVNDDEDGDESPGKPEDSDSINISFHAKKLAEENEIDVNEIEGTGKDGQITKGDVQAAIDAMTEDPPTE